MRKITLFYLVNSGKNFFILFNLLLTFSTFTIVHISVFSEDFALFISLLQVCLFALEEEKELPEEKEGKALSKLLSPTRKTSLLPLSIYIFLVFGSHDTYLCEPLEVKKQSEEENKLRQMRKEDYRSKVIFMHNLLTRSLS